MTNLSKKSASAFSTLGARNFAKESRQEHDFYATDPVAIELLLDELQFEKDVWECACGKGHISEVLKAHGYNVFSSDLIKRGYEDEQIDFLKSERRWRGAIITNPPYRHALAFTKKALESVYDGNHVVMFLRLLFLEGKERRAFFEKFPPKQIYVSSNRIACAKDGDFEKGGKTKAVCFAWFVWQKGFLGEPTIRWFN